MTARKTRKTIVGRIDPEILAFTVGRDTELDLELTEADCVGTAAHVTMLAALPVKPRILGRSEARRVIAELVKIVRNARAGKFRISPEDQDVHLAIERILTARLGETGRRIHTARSRNDQVALDLRLYAREQLLGVMEEAAQLALELLSLAAKNRLVPMVGRTHHQPAMPSSVGVWASAHAESLLDDLHLLSAVSEINNRSPLGSAAGYGVPLTIDRKMTARLLGFDAPIHNVLYAGNARGKCESLILSALGQVMLSLSRLAQDLILFSMPEFGWFSLPPEYCTGSSIMPQKKNPDVLELIRAKTAQVLASASSVGSIVKDLPSGYHRDLQLTKEPFIEGFRKTRASLRIMTRIAAGVSVNRKALRNAFTPEVFAADFALDRVLRGESFRKAYDYVKEHLDKLENMNPSEAVRRKTHLGAPAGLDLGMLKARVRGFERLVKSRRRMYHRKLTRLLGPGW